MRQWIGKVNHRERHVRFARVDRLAYATWPESPAGTKGDLLLIEAIGRNADSLDGGVAVGDGHGAGGWGVVDSREAIVVGACGPIGCKDGVAVAIDKSRLRAACDDLGAWGFFRTSLRQSMDCGQDGEERKEWAAWKHFGGYIE